MFGHDARRPLHATKLRVVGAILFKYDAPSIFEVRRRSGYYEHGSVFYTLLLQQSVARPGLNEPARALTSGPSIKYRSK